MRIFPIFVPILQYNVNEYIPTPYSLLAAATVCGTAFCATVVLFIDKWGEGRCSSKECALRACRAA